MKPSDRMEQREIGGQHKNLVGLVGFVGSVIICGDQSFCDSDGDVIALKNGDWLSLREAKSAGGKTCYWIEVNGRNYCGCISLTDASRILLTIDGSATMPTTRDVGNVIHHLKSTNSFTIANILKCPERYVADCLMQLSGSESISRTDNGDYCLIYDEYGQYRFG